MLTIPTENSAVYFYSLEIYNTTKYGIYIKNLLQEWYM
jgi:hypothetical protein